MNFGLANVWCIDTGMGMKNLLRELCHRWDDVKKKRGWKQ